MDAVLPPTAQLTTVTIQANSFVYKMVMPTAFQAGDQQLVFSTFSPGFAVVFFCFQVRNIVGALVKVGLGEMSADEMRILLAKRDRTLAPSLAPPHGLYLVDVHYPSSCHSFPSSRSNSCSSSECLVRDAFSAHSQRCNRCQGNSGVWNADRL